MSMQPPPDPTPAPNPYFPRYEMIINGRPEWCVMILAAHALNSDSMQVSFGSQVMEENDNTRPLTGVDRLAIMDLADEYIGG